MRFFTASAGVVLVLLLALVGSAFGGRDDGPDRAVGPPEAGGGSDTGAPLQDGLEVAVFIDVVRHFHGGPPPHEATDAATDVHLINGGISWPSASTVRYSLDASGCSNDCGGAVAAVNAGFDAWEVSGVTFTQDNTNPDQNPCSDDANSVNWTAIDGVDGVVAQTFVCFNPATKEIMGFEMQFDADDAWTDSADGNRLDIQGTAAHEAGHAVGLDHVNPPKAARLTMFPFIALDDAGIRTLGCGDRLGVNRAYATSLDCSGLPDD